jgi:K+/H+ antiporter YhaU regulatory subunit KhtT
VSDALVLAIRDHASGGFHYNPGPDTVLASGVTLVLLGRTASIGKLRHAIGGGPAK